MPYSERKSTAKSTRKALVRCFFALTCLASAGAAGAANLEVVSQMEIQSEYSNNIYLTDNNKKDDITSRVSPGLGLTWHTPKSHLKMNYKFSAMEYRFPRDKNFPEREDNYRLWHELKVKGETHARSFGAKRLYAGFDTEFMQNNDPHRVERGYLVGRNEYRLYRFGPRLRYKRGRQFQLTLRYRREVLRYRNSDIENSDEHKGLVNFQLRLNSKNRLEGEYQQALRDFPLSQDYRLHQGWLKLRHRANSHLEGLCGVGYQIRNYDRGPIPDWKGVTFLARLQGDSKNKIRGRITYQYLANTVGAFVFYRIHRLDFYGAYKPFSPLTLLLDPYVQWDRYREPAGREDMLAGLGGRLRYSFAKGWYWEVAYYRLSRHSNRDGNDYREDNFFLALSWNHEWL